MTIDALPVGISTEEFKGAFRNHPAGVAVLTAHVGDEHAAMTVSSLFSISAEPPLIGFSVSELASAARIFDEATSVVIHMIDADSLWLAKLGATSGITRFEEPSQWGVLPTGERYFHGAPTVVRATVVERIRAGRSTLCVVRARELLKSDASDGSAQAAPIVYHNRTWHRLGDSSAVRE